MVETITLKEVLDWMDTGAPFSIAFVTSDDKRKLGGEWIEIKQASKYVPFTRAEQERLDKAQPRVRTFKNPNHYENSTRNIELKNKDIRKVHIRLIRRFNGKIVT